jgi:hypothetical protein
MSNQELSSSHLYLKAKQNKTWHQANHISNQSCYPFSALSYIKQKAIETKQKK